MELTHPYLTQRIIGTLEIQEEPKTHVTHVNVTLNRDENGLNRVQDWNYRSAMGMMSCLASTSRTDVFFDVHQCAWF